MEKPKITYNTLINYLTAMENATDLRLMIAKEDKSYEQIDILYINAICQSVLNNFIRHLKDKTTIELWIKDMEEAYSGEYDPMWEKIEDR